MFVSPQFLKKASRRIPWSSEVLALRPEPQSSFACFFCLSEERRGTNFTISSVLQRCVGCPLQEHSTSEHLPSLLSNRASLTKRRTIITEDNSVDKWVVHPPDSTQPVCDQIRPPWTAPPQTLVGGGGGGLHKSLHFISLASSELNCVHHYHLNFRRICTAIL